MSEPDERTLMKVALATIFHTARILRDYNLGSAASQQNIGATPGERIQVSMAEAEEVLKQAGLP